MPDERTEIAVEAAAKAMHQTYRESRQFTWETSSEQWREEMRDFVRPSVEAALEASDAFLAAAIPKPKTEEPPR